MREQALTVAELIRVLETMPQNMPVRMGMNLEYESIVTADMVEVFETYEGDKFVYITDTPGYGSDDDRDGQPDEAQEWYDFDPEC
jgi:hypothetical protein